MKHRRNAYIEPANTLEPPSSLPPPPLFLPFGRCRLTKEATKTHKKHNKQRLGGGGWGRASWIQFDRKHRELESLYQKTATSSNKLTARASTISPVLIIRLVHYFKVDTHRPYHGGIVGRRASNASQCFDKLRVLCYASLSKPYGVKCCAQNAHLTINVGRSIRPEGA